MFCLGKLKRYLNELRRLTASFPRKIKKMKVERETEKKSKLIFLHEINS